MHRSLSKCVPLLALAIVAACPCDPSSPGGRPSRGADLRADLKDSAGIYLGLVFASLSETHGNPWPRSLAVSINDQTIGIPSPVAGHILHLRLLDSAFRVVQEIETFPGNANTNSILTRTVMFSSTENARYDSMRQLFLSGKTILEVETDQPGREHIRTSLPLYQATGWVRSSCD